MKLCECGCGNPVAKKSNRFLIGHRGKKPWQELFWKKVEKRAPGECWGWRAATLDFGYGVCRTDEGNKAAHRISWELHNGPIPEGMCVCHKCDNPPCCNPAHLFLGTNADNAKDMVSKNRFDSRISENDVFTIRASWPETKMQDLANRYGVSLSAISLIINRKRWSHIP